MKKNSLTIRIIAIAVTVLLLIPIVASLIGALVAMK